MKYKTFVKELNLKKDDFENIKKSIQNAEKKTTGEIAVAIASESNHYSFWELLTANCLASVVLLVMVLFSSKIESLYNMLYWQYKPDWVIPMFYVVIYFLAIFVIFHLCNIPAIDRIIIPHKAKTISVTQRAFRYFTESGVYNTAEHSGILVFVSYMERQVRIIADEGISKKISQDKWDLLVNDFSKSMKEGNITTAFTTIINKCGNLLSEHFPNKEENPNELEDGLVILGDEEWF